MTISKSQMYGLVINRTYVARFKRNHEKNAKRKGGTVYNAPSK